jgi:hypothetical protein
LRSIALLSLVVTGYPPAALLAIRKSCRIGPHKRPWQRRFSKTSALGDSSRHAGFPLPLVEILYFATNGEPFLAGQKVG